MSHLEIGESYPGQRYARRNSRILGVLTVVSVIVGILIMIAVQ